MDHRAISHPPQRLPASSPETMDHHTIIPSSSDHIGHHHRPMVDTIKPITKLAYRGRFCHSLPDCSNKEDDGFDGMPEYTPYDEEYLEPPEHADTVFIPRTRPGPEEEEEEELSPLNVEDIDMCERGFNKWTGDPDTTYDNKFLHHTKEYDNPRLVVRRGQEFFIRIRFCRDFYADFDDFQLEFLIGNDPTPGQQLIQLLFGVREDSDKHTDWLGSIVSVDGAQVTLSITPSANAIVGRFKMYVAIAKTRGMLRTRRDPTTDIYVLFNAWCPDDPVYLEDERQERQEYVLEDGGTIYQGDPSAVSERSWMYGQFELGVLDACIYILDSSQMLIVHRADPVKLVRKGSAMLNSQDDNGVLVGNWSDDYSMGVAPTLWTGSVKILLQYAHTGIPVCYAQCWVFAGVFNTFLRCLGIPARVITNFSSAHDNTGNLKTDLIFLHDGTPDHKNTRDSIWNYHCWNEAWMARHDLGEGLGGWQAVDATPQETSDGYYRCGPASVRAIKDGLMSQMYDAAFVFAEVNSDLVFRKRDKYGLLKTFRVDKTHVGHVILTKAVGWDRPDDITRNYKYHEGSKEDKITMARAEVYGMAREIPEYLTADARVSVKIDCKQVGLGEAFTLGIDIINDGDTEAKASFTLVGRVVFYTGVVTKEFKDHREPTMIVPANETHRVYVNVEAREYMTALGSQVSLQFVLTGQASHQYLSSIRVITLKTPPLTLVLSGVHKVGYEMYVNLKFTNPLGDSLFDVWVAMEGPGLMVFRTKYYREVAPYATLSWTEGFIPRMGGKRRMMAALDCDKLRQVWGVTRATIEYS